MAVATEAELVSYCDVPAGDTVATALVVQLETYVVAMLQQLLGLYLGTSASKTHYLDGGSYKVFLPQIPISVTSVATRPAESSDDWTILDADDYLVTANRIRKMDGVLFPDGEETVRVISSMGYNGADWQLPIKRLVLSTVNWMAKVGRKASVEEILKESDSIPHWNETVKLYARPLYG